MVCFSPRQSIREQIYETTGCGTFTRASNWFVVWEDSLYPLVVRSWFLPVLCITLFVCCASGFSLPVMFFCPRYAYSSCAFRHHPGSIWLTRLRLFWERSLWTASRCVFRAWLLWCGSQPTPPWQIPLVRGNTADVVGARLDPVSNEKWNLYQLCVFGLVLPAGIAGRFPWTAWQGGEVWIVSSESDVLCCHNGTHSVLRRARLVDDEVVRHWLAVLHCRGHVSHGGPGGFITTDSVVDCCGSDGHVLLRWQSLSAG